MKFMSKLNPSTLKQNNTITISIDKSSDHIKGKSFIEHKNNNLIRISNPSKNKNNNKTNVTNTINLLHNRDKTFTHKLKINTTKNSTSNHCYKNSFNNSTIHSLYST